MHNKTKNFFRMIFFIFANFNSMLTLKIVYTVYIAEMQPQQHFIIW